MKIRGFLCVTTATTNEEYRKVLKKRNIWSLVLVLIGMLMCGTALYASQSQKAALSGQYMCMYNGFAIGIALAGALLYTKNMILLENEEKLKQSRLENSDERLTEISYKASKISAMVMVIAIVAGGMIWGIFEPVLIRAMVFLIDVFALSYIAAFSYYKRKM